jgi:hypothetical protein
MIRLIGGHSVQPKSETLKPLHLKKKWYLILGIVLVFIVAIAVLQTRNLGNGNEYKCTQNCTYNYTENINLPTSSSPR